MHDRLTKTIKLLWLLRMHFYYVATRLDTPNANKKILMSANGFIYPLAWNTPVKINEKQLRIEKI